MTDEQKLPTLKALRGVKFEIIVDDTNHVVIKRFKDGARDGFQRISFSEFQEALASGGFAVRLQALAEG